MTSQRPSMVKSLAWLIGSRFANLAVSLLLTAVLARFISPADYGLMVATTIIVNLANAIFDGAFGIELVRTAILENDHVQRLLNAAVTLGAILTGLMIAVSPLVQAFYGFDRLAFVMVATAPVIMAKSVFSVCTAMLQQRGKFRSIGLIALVANPVASLFVAVPLAVAGFGIWALVAGLLASALFETLLSMWAARPPLRLRFAGTLLDDLRGEGGRFALSQTLNWAATSGSNIVSGHVLGLYALGLYSRGWRLLDIAVSGTAGPMQRVFTPFFATMQTDLVAMRRSFLSYHRALSAGFAVLSALICMNAQAIVLILLGQKWLDTVPIVQILFSALISRSLYKLSEGVIFSLGRSRTAVGLQGIYAILMIGGSALGSRWGAVGVAAAASGAVWAYYIVSFVMASRTLRIDAATAIGVHVSPLVWAATTVALEVGIGTLLSPLGFWIAAVLSGLFTVALLSIALLVVPPRWLGFDPWAGFITPLASKVSAFARSVPKSESPQTFTYVYGQPLPNTSANAGAIFDLLKALGAIGHSVRLIRRGGSGTDGDIRIAYELGDQPTLHRAPHFFGGLGGPILALAAMRLSATAVILTRMPQIAVMATLFGHPVVLELHQQIGLTRMWGFWRRVLALRRSQMVVVATTPAIIAKFDPVAKSSVASFIEAPSSANDLSGDFAPTRFDVGYIGSFLPGKGMDMVADIAAARPDLRIVVIGDPRPNPDIARRLQAMPNVTLGGHVLRRDLAATLHSFTLALAPYAAAGFGGNEHQPFIPADNLSSLKIVEYMSASRVVIASRIQAVETVVRDGVEAILCDPHRLDDWLAAIDRCMGSADLRAQLSRAGRLRYETAYSIHRRAALIVDAARSAQEAARHR